MALATVILEHNLVFAENGTVYDTRLVDERTYTVRSAQEIADIICYLHATGPKDTEEFSPDDGTWLSESHFWNIVGGSNWNHEMFERTFETCIGLEYALQDIPF